MKRFLIFPILFALGTACASLPPKEYTVTPTSSILGVEVEFPGFLWVKRPPVQVFFVKAPRRGDLNRITEVIPASWIKGNRAYLLNPEPGDYYVVAGNFEVKQPQGQSSSTNLGGGVSMSVSTGGGSIGHSVIMTEEFIRNTKTRVNSGQIAYMGKLALKDGSKINAKAQLADDYQKKFADLVVPGATSKSGLSGFFSTVWMLDVNKSSYSKEPANRQAFEQTIKSDFAKSAWGPMVGAPAAE